ncbi:cytochrome c biogenesis protein ResB [Evansella tamaricis]|uniref:Cytochrome c biogenesis protein ResB n=1 Tax=Evansella tamaricis TaxID=2069301 RepID=A0ABS6JPG8_9BACI|nr:cytochrome c biogenesis protein ResB [Evansella tamaricis]MBU9714290.1 cytochrome c biogenesis protein ResB [Evansella tamaricis]
MEKVKCDCGHVNPYGTYLCESCGKPLLDDNQSLADMRYEGVARRSQTYSKSVVDKVWNFFSSVKVGIWIIVLILLASMLGTIFPQEMYIPAGERASTYYEQEYGVLGKLYYQLGLHTMYSSWWYMLLIASLGISLVICSLDRVVPLHRALKTQRVTRHKGFLSRQKLFSKTEKMEEPEKSIEKAEKVLKEKHYRIFKEDGNILAEKGRFARWGPYVNHVGLIIFLIGAMLRFFPEMYIDEHIWVREGEQVVIRGTDGEYFLRNDEFIVELYDEEDERFRESFERTGGNPVVKTFQTSATLLKRINNEGPIGLGTEFEEIMQYDIRVNDPLTFDGYSLYQVDYKLNELSEFTFTLQRNEDSSEEDLSDIQFTVDLFNPELVYEFENGYRVEIFQYFPNFYINDQKEPDTLNRIPDNPRIIFEVFTPEMNPDTDRGELSLVGVQVNEALNGDNNYRIRMIDVDMNHVTALTVRRDRTLPILIVGGVIFMIGLVQGSYWYHRRIWLQNRDGEIWVAGHTNKNWHGLKKDFETITKNTAIPMPLDQTDDWNLIEEVEGVKGKDDSSTSK